MAHKCAALKLIHSREQTTYLFVLPHILRLLKGRYALLLTRLFVLLNSLTLLSTTKPQWYRGGARLFCGHQGRTVRHNQLASSVPRFLLCRQWRWRSLTWPYYSISRATTLSNVKNVPHLVSSSKPNDVELLRCREKDLPNEPNVPALKVLTDLLALLSISQECLFWMYTRLVTKMWGTGLYWIDRK